MLLSSSIRGGHKRAIGISLGVTASFFVLTLIISFLFMVFNLDSNFFRIIASLSITFLGLTLIIPTLLIHYEMLIRKVSIFIGGQSLSKHHGFIGGIIIGLSIGLIWLPSVAPVFTTIATLPVNKTFSIETILVTFAFAIGVGIPFVLLSLIGTFFFKENKFISKYNNLIQKVIGIFMIITALAIYTNYDKIIHSNLLNLFPAYVNFVKKM